MKKNFGLAHRLPPLEVVTAVTFLCVAAIIILVIRPEWTLNRKFDASIGLTISAFTAFFITTFPIVLRRFGRWGDERKFMRFFGAVTKQTRGAILVFIHRTAPEEINLETLVHHEKAKRGESIGPARSEGLSGWLPMQDLRGANYVGGELAKVVRQTSYFRTDRDLLTDPLDQIRATVISFGLGFNQFTHRLITSTGHGLFDVAFSMDPSGKFVTDNIELPDLGILLPSKGSDISIIVRIPHPMPDAAPSRFFFLCAGRTATGTAVAGRYLASNWKELLQMYKRVRKDGSMPDLDEDALLVVLAHRYHTAESEDDASEIALDENGEQLVRWWSRVNNRLKIGGIDTSS